MTAVPPTITERLRVETRELHAAAERHPFQKSLAAGRITREAYQMYLAQMLHVHRALEGALRRHAATPAIAAVVHEDQFQERHLRADLTFFGRDPDQVKVLDETREIAAGIVDSARIEPLILLGRHYVLEGSKNGSRFIARAVGPALGLDGDGLRFLLPYGEAQAEKWRAFKAAMDALPLDAEQSMLLVSAATSMFLDVFRISDGVFHRMAAAREDSAA